MRECMAAVAAFAIAGAAVVRADADGRAEHDIRVKISLSHREGAPVARVKMRNRGTSPESGVLLEIRADSESGTLLWTGTADLGMHRARAFRVAILPPVGATALVAVAVLDGVGDGNPSDNVARAWLGTGSGGPGTASASLGAALYTANCFTCHGAGAYGLGDAPGIRGEKAEEILEAIREGEEGMPTFPSFGAAEARALQAYLADPEAAAPQPPPPPPPPPGTAPTYTGRVKTLLDTRCGACHTGKNAAASLRLDTYNQASSNAAAALAAVQAGRMPPDGPLMADEIAILQGWIDGGRQP